MRNFRVVAGLMLMMASLLEASVQKKGYWQIGKIENRSDLKLVSAWYLKPKPTQISALDVVFNVPFQPQSAQIISFALPPNQGYTVSAGSHGCSFIKTEQGYEIPEIDMSPKERMGKLLYTKKVTPRGIKTQKDSLKISMKPHKLQPIQG